jgi:O-antigen/teichoic acid export membrane protein
MTIDGRTDETLSRVRRWAGRGFWAVADQAFISVSNFLLNVLLARWLAANEYGAFTVGFSLLLVIGSFHGAFLTDPMLVFGASRFAGEARSYLRVLVFGHWVLTGSLALVALGGALGLRLLGMAALPGALLGLALAAPLYLLLLLLRRACYVTLEPRQSASASGLYLVASLLCAFALSRTTTLSPASGFLALAGGSLVSSAWLVSRLGVPWSLPGRAEVSEVLAVHWGFSRWTLGANLAQWVRGNLYYFLLPVWGGLEASAAFRAMANLIMPLTQPLVAISPILLPAFTRARSRPDFGATVGRVGILLTAGAGAYWIFLGWFGEPILDWIYAGKYVEHARMAWVLGLIPVCTAIGAAVATALRALERPDRDFWATAISAALALSVGAFLTRLWGVGGAIAGLALSYVVATLLMTAIFVSLRAGTRPPGGERS